MFISSPDENLSNLNLHSGQVVCDLGAGSGHHSVAIGKLIGGSGTVYAVEVKKDLLSMIQTHARHLGLSNVKAIWGDIEKHGGIKLADGLCDVAVMANVFFQIEDKPGCAKEISRFLKKGGTLLVIDWKDSSIGSGSGKNHVVTESMARQYFENVGFEHVRTFDAKHHHYGMIFKKNK